MNAVQDYTQAGDDRDDELAGDEEDDDGDIDGKDTGFGIPSVPISQAPENQFLQPGGPLGQTPIRKAMPYRVPLNAVPRPVDTHCN